MADRKDRTNNMIITWVLPSNLLPKVNRRAAQLDMNRSQYLRHVVRCDIDRASRATLRLEAKRKVAA